MRHAAVLNVLTAHMILHDVPRTSRHHHTPNTRHSIDPTTTLLRQPTPQMGLFENFMEELDNFIDDATMRRMGNGAKFYGKRKSSFYGKDDAMRKKDPKVADEAEDWRGPGGGSFFVLSKERDEQGRPVGFLSRKEARAQKAKEEQEKWDRVRESNSLMGSFAKALRPDDDE